MKHSKQTQDILDRLTPAEAHELYETLLLETRKRTKTEALVIASLLETQLKVVGLHALAADVANIEAMLRDFQIK